MRDGGRITSTEESSFRKTMNILFPFAVYFVVHDLAQIVLAFLAGLGAGIFGDAYMEFVEINAATVNGALNALSLVIGMAAVWPMAGKELKWAKVLSGGDAAVKMERRAKAAEYVLLALFAAVFALAVNMLMVLAGLTRISESYQEVAGRQYGVAFGVGLLIYGLISPLAEETVFRGLIYNRMRRYFGKILSVVVCGIMFGVYHGNLVQGIYGCILGIAITYSYEWFGSFSAPVLFHAMANIAVFIAGYDQVVKGNIVTPLNCGVLAVLAGLILYAMKKVRERGML